MSNPSAQEAQTGAAVSVSAPLFTVGPSVNMSGHQQPGVSQQPTNPNAINLDEIFGDCFFTPEGDTVILDGNDDDATAAVPVVSIQPTPTVSIQPTPTTSALSSSLPPSSLPSSATSLAHTDHSGRAFHPGAIINVSNAPIISRETQPATVAHRPDGMSVPLAVPAHTPGGVPTAASVVKAVAPPPRHHMSFVTGPVVKRGGRGGGGPGGRGSDRKMSEKQKVERRERNREHAKRSRIRKKFLLESLQQSVSLLKEENEKLRQAVRGGLGEAEAEHLFAAETERIANGESNPGGSIVTGGDGSDANKVLDDPDFSFIKALQTAQQNFVVTDPSLPDNPIVYATQGFLSLTGYTLDQVLGRNCRFLQGPDTDPKAVEKIRKAIEEGSDMSVCLLNYRVDGTTFWNQFFIAALRDAGGSITNYVGVQCKVSDQYAANVCKKQEEADKASANACGEGGEEGEDDDGDE